MARAWFQGGPLDGHETDVPDPAPDHLELTLTSDDRPLYADGDPLRRAGWRYERFAGDDTSPGYRVRST